VLVSGTDKLSKVRSIEIRLFEMVVLLVSVTTLEISLQEVSSTFGTSPARVLLFGGIGVDHTVNPTISSNQ